VNKVFAGSIVPFETSDEEDESDEAVAAPAPRPRRKEGQLQLPPAEPEVAG
jgi:hypothetical protein